MAKKKQIEAFDIEQAIQKALAGIPGIHYISESAYCELVLEALDAIKTGLEMCKSELGEGE